MQIKPIEHASLCCIFADEMRREADGRDTLLGWYPDGAKIALAPEGATTMPRLMVVAILTVPLDTAPADAHFSLLLDDAVIHTNTVPSLHFEKAMGESDADPGPLRAGMYRMAMQAQNLVIEQAGRLRVRAVMGDLVLNSNSLQFVRPEVPPAEGASAQDA